MHSKPSKHNTDKIVLRSGLGMSFFAGIAALALYLRYGENTIIDVLWLFSVSFVLFVSLWSLRRVLTNTLKGVLNIHDRVFLIIVLLMFLIGFYLRFTHLNILPEDLHGDMASYGIQARQLMNNFHVVGVGWYDIPYVAFLPTLLGMKVFGNNLFGMSFVSVIEGTISLVGIYLLAQYLFKNKWISLLSLTILTFNVAHIHFSRISAYMDPIPWMIFALLLLLMGLDRKYYPFVILAGLFSGVAMYMYYAGRIILVFAVLIFLDKFVQRVMSIRKVAVLFLLYICAILLVFGPSTAYFISHPESFNSRTQQVLISDPQNLKHMSGIYGATDTWSILKGQLFRSFGLFHVRHDTSTQFGYPAPMFNPLLGISIIFGLITMIIKIRSFPFRMLLLISCITIIIGGVLTIDPPFWPRLVIMTVWGSLMGAIGITFMLHLLSRIFLRGWFYVTGLIIMFSAVCIYGYVDWNIYQQFALSNGSPRVISAKYINSQYSNDYHICGFTGSLDPSTREIAFLLFPKKTYTLTPSLPLIIPEECKGDKVVWLLETGENIISRSIQNGPKSNRQRVVYNHQKQALSIVVDPL